MKCAFYTLGCKVNQYESAAMAQAMEKNGITCVDSEEEADIYVINSCSVTAESDRKTRQTVRRYKKNHPSSIIVLTGCMTQATPETCESLEEADIVLGNANNEKLFGLVMKYIKTGKRIVDIEPHTNNEKFKGDMISDFYGRTRANLKIEDGCNRFCSYCIIPYARGRVRSKPLEDIRREVADLTEKGFQEIVLVGINLSAYGTEKHAETPSNIVEAVEAVASFDGVKRVRLGSLEPDHITDKVISGLAQIDKFCPQFHISLQSGCDDTLKRMNRHYNSVEYEDLCFKLRQAFPDCTLTTDVMVGFPGETDSDFNISLDFVKKIGFEKVHVFPYSRRPGTPAARMSNQVDNALKQHRAEIMIDETEKIRREFLRNQIGRTLYVLPEENHNGTVQGYTANYTPVKILTDRLSKEILKVKITGVEEDFCIGEITE